MSTIRFITDRQTDRQTDDSIVPTADHILPSTVLPCSQYVLMYSPDSTTATSMVQKVGSLDGVGAEG